MNNNNNSNIEEQYEEYVKWLKTQESKLESTPESKYTPSFGIQHWINTLTKSEEPTILNLKTKLKEEEKSKFNVEEYKTFVDYFHKIVKKVSVELDQLKGPIIESHILPINTTNTTNNTEYTKAMQEIVDKYKTLYLKDLKNDGNHKLTSDKKEIFPNYLGDLYLKNDKPYTEFEEQSGLTKPIVEQTDKEFFDTLELRIKGLEICKNDKEKDVKDYQTDEDYKYFLNEYNRERKNYNDLQFPELNKNTKTISIDNTINSQCNAISYGKKTIENFDFDKFKVFIEKNDSKEKKILKTFLPKICFDENQDINYVNLKKLLNGTLKDKGILIDNKKYRQYTFGFFDEEEISEIRNHFRFFLYEAGGGTFKNMCNPLVNWSTMLNLLYCKCSISNTEILCPARFIIPKREYIEYTEKESYIEFILRDKASLLDLFNNKNKENKENSKFIGIITIKYFHEQSNSYRVWFLYVFNNKLLVNPNDLRRDSITGLYDKYFTINSNLKFINKGSLFEKHNVTHTELSFFVKKALDKEIYFYMTSLDDKTILLSKFNNLEKNDFLSNLELRKVQISIDKDENNINKFKVYYNKKNMTGGNINKLHLKLQITNNEKQLYFGNIKISSIQYNNYLNNINKFSNLTKESINNKSFKELYILSKYLYNYLLISYNEIYYSQDINTINYNYLTITKYKPISLSFYKLNEIFQIYKITTQIENNIYNKNENNILCFGNNLSIIELLQFKNYKIKNITNIFCSSQIYYDKNINIFNKIINNISKLYNFNSILFDKNIYELLDFQNSKIFFKNKLVYYDIFIRVRGVGQYEHYYNTANILVGILLGLKYTSINGTFILYLGSVAYKHIADLYIIVSKYFKTHNLYYPEISNLIKNNGTIAIFTSFIGINDNEYNDIINIYNKVKNILTNGGYDFNIYNEEIRKNNFMTYKKIDTELEKQEHFYIIGFLDTKPDNPIYNEIKNFNEEHYLKQDIYMNKLLKYINISIKELELIKIPTPEQLTNAILYCKKYDIPYIDKFSNPVFQDKFGKQILHEAYGLHEPIIYIFKTPFKLHLGPNSRKSIKLISRHTSRHASRHTLKNKLSKTMQTKNRKTRKTSKINSYINFNNDSFRLSKLFSKTHKTHKQHKQHKQHKSSKYSPNSTTANLIPELEFSNNRIEQTTKLIDSRRDFDAPDSPHDMQNAKWFEANKQFRYYKHKEDKEKTHLDVLVRNIINDKSVSQAWLKMYEIITDCKIVPTGRKGTFKSFHICEAPGTFISCLNNYIHTKTKYDSFEWKAQSLKKSKDTGKDTAFGDDFNLIKRNKDKWDWGVDGSGDITNIANIQHYAKVVKEMQNLTQHNILSTSKQPIDLITSDCGLPMKCKGYEKVAFASLLSILHILPKGGSMVYKILSPIDEPIILNLIYIAYTNFKDLIFYKPVQNSQSREFYIIGKGYLGTDSHIIEKLFDELKKFKEGEEADLFADTYPEIFVRQMVQASTILADNFVYTIERQIYFVDNSDVITPDFIKLFYNYYNEKNKDWIDKYNVRQIDKQFVL